MRELGIVQLDETHYDETENETHADMLSQYSTSSNVAQGCNWFPKGT